MIGKRWSRLSEKANQVLSIASVIGRDFRFDVLQMVMAAASPPVMLREQGLGEGSGSGPKHLEGGLEEEIDAALEEASERALIEARPAVGTLAFRFTHAFFRQTLYDELFASRRLRLHQQTVPAGNSGWKKPSDALGLFHSISRLLESTLACGQRSLAQAAWWGRTISLSPPPPSPATGRSRPLTSRSSAGSPAYRS